MAASAKYGVSGFFVVGKEGIADCHDGPLHAQVVSRRSHSQTRVPGQGIHDFGYHQSKSDTTVSYNVITQYYS